jgi:hypothetical protein
MFKYTKFEIKMLTYCNNLARLINNGYVDGELVYLQKLAVPSTMDEDLKTCQFCMQCGTPLSNHNYDTSGCLILRNMTTLNQLQNIDNQFIFNLEQTTTANGRMTGDPNYPERFRLYHCPYCSEEYEYEPKSNVI